MVAFRCSDNITSLALASAISLHGEADLLTPPQLKSTISVLLEILPELHGGHGSCIHNFTLHEREFLLQTELTTGKNLSHAAGPSMLCWTLRLTQTRSLPRVSAVVWRVSFASCILVSSEPGTSVSLSIVTDCSFPKKSPAGHTRQLRLKSRRSHPQSWRKHASWSRQSRRPS